MYNQSIRQLLREVRFHLIRFEEDENPEELQDACNVLANIAEELGMTVEDAEAPEPSAN